jgi:hypothetical protein
LVPLTNLIAPPLYGKVYLPQKIITTMIVSITHIELKSGWKFFKLSALAQNIVRELRINAACKSVKTRGFWTSHYTMTLWESREAMEQFYRHGDAHKAAMTESANLAKTIKTFSYEDNALPSWDDAKVLLPEGKLLVFG